MSTGRIRLTVRRRGSTITVDSRMRLKNGQLSYRGSDVYSESDMLPMIREIRRLHRDNYKWERDVGQKESTATRQRLRRAGF